MAGPCFLGIDVSIHALVAVTLFRTDIAGKLNTKAAKTAQAIKNPTRDTMISTDIV